MTASLRHNLLVVLCAGILGLNAVAAGAAEPDALSNSPPSGRNDAVGDPLPDGAQLRLGTTRLRQRQGVEGVAFSPDGKQLASTGWGDSIRLWDLGTARQARRLRTDEGDGTFAVAFSPDGTKLASVGENGIVRLWNLETGEVVFKVLGHKERSYGVRTYGVAFAPDGTTFATGGADPSIRIWDVASGLELLELRTEEGGGDSRPVAFSADGNLLATGDRRGTIYIWNLQTGGDPRVIHEAHGRDIVSLVFVPGAEILISSGSRLERVSDRSVRSVSEIHIWNPSTGAQQGSFEAEDKLIGEPTLALSTDGRVLASSHYGKIVVWNLESRRPRRIIEEEAIYYGGRTHGLAVSPDGKLIASKARYHKVHLWEVDTGRPVFPQEEAHSGGVISIGFSPDGSTIATGSEDATVRLWDIASGRYLRSLNKGTGWVRYVELFHDGRRVALGAETWSPGQPGFRGEAKICEMTDGSVVRHFLTSDRVMCGALAPQGDLVAVATGLGESPFSGDSTECKIYVWDVESGKPRVELVGHRRQILDIAYGSEKDVLWSVSEDQTVRKWDLKSGRELEQVDLKAGEAPPIFRRAVFADAVGTVMLGGMARVDRETSVGKLQMKPIGRESRWELTFSESLPSAMAVSPDGRTLAVYLRPLARSGASGRIALYSAESGEELTSFELEDGVVRSIAFSPDGARIASGMDRGDTLVWELPAASRRSP